MNEFRNKRKELEYQLRREFIIEVAQKLFYEKGYENVTLNEVAKKADYTKATLYSYIKSKEDLYMEVYCVGLQERLDYLKKEMSKVKTGLAKVEMFGKAYYEFYKNHPQILYHQQYIDYRPINPEKIDPNLMERFQKINVEAIKEGIADNTIKEDLDPNYLYSQIIYALRAVASAAVYRRKAVLEEENTEEINKNWYYSFLDLLMNAITKK
jgi:AcrR family transcriptional regulator